MSIINLFKTIVTLGDGDVLTGFGAVEGKGVYSLMQLAEAREPGSKATDLEGKVKASDADVTIQFRDVEALDRFMSDLTKLREQMAGAA